MTRRRDFDVLRVCSMLGVIYLHVASGALNRPQEGGLWAFSNPIAALSAAAVPLFFMLSGALLLHQEKTAELGHLFHHRLPRVIVPALCWSGLILCYLMATGKGEQAMASLSTLLNTPVVVPYWFLYALVPLYLLSPFLKLMTDRMEESHWQYALALWAGLTLGLATLRLFVPQELEMTFTEHWTMNINVAGGYLGYFLLGAYLDRHKTPKPVPLAFGVLLCLCASVVGTWWDTTRTMAYSTRFTDYLSLLTAALSRPFSFWPWPCGRTRAQGPSCLCSPVSPFPCTWPILLSLGSSGWCGAGCSSTPTLSLFRSSFAFICWLCLAAFLALLSCPTFRCFPTSLPAKRREKRGKSLDSARKMDII